MEQEAAHSSSIFRHSRLSFWQQYQELWVLFLATCGHYRLVNRVHHRLGKLSIMFGWRRFDLHINDDLVGFMRSVPQTRLLDAVHEWQNRHSEISVDLSQKGAALETTFSGSFRSPGFRHESVSGTDTLLWYRLVCGLNFPTRLAVWWIIWRQRRC